MGIEFCTSVHNSLLQLFFAVEEADDLHHIVHTIDFQPVHHGCLPRILTGKDEAVVAKFPRFNSNRKGTLDRHQSTVKPHLAHDNKAFKTARIYLAICSQNTDSKR